MVIPGAGAGGTPTRSGTDALGSPTAGAGGPDSGTTFGGDSPEEGMEDSETPGEAEMELSKSPRQGTERRAYLLRRIQHRTCPPGTQLGRTLGETGAEYPLQALLQWEHRWRRSQWRLCESQRQPLGGNFHAWPSLEEEVKRGTTKRTRDRERTTFGAAVPPELGRTLQIWESKSVLKEK
jgi:hypothetical protein